MKVKKSMPFNSMSTKVKCVTVMLAGLALTGCSDNQKEQAKQASKEAVAPAIEKVENAVEDKVETAVSETKEVIAGKAEEVKELVVEATAPIVKESAPVVEEPAPVAVVEEATPAVETAPAAKESVEPKTHIIKAAVTQFKPLVVFANPGDTIVWQNMAGHDTTSMKGMLPEGAETWQSAMGELFSLTVEKEGAYLYKCTPHASMGMMGAIVVGHSDNLEAIKAGVDTSGEPKGMVKRVIRKVEKELSKK